MSAVIWTQRGKRRRPEAPDLGPMAVQLPVGFADAIDAAVYGGWEAVGRLVDMLVKVDAAADVSLGRSALSQLVGTPRAVVRLDEHARRNLWYRPHSTPLSAGLVSMLQDGAIGPLGLALASTHRDGRVREAAIAQMLTAPIPEFVPFLVIRTSDWVKQVRDRARAGLALLLADDPAGMLPAAMGISLLVDGRLRGGFARTQLAAVLITAPVAIRDQFAASPRRDQRRFVFDVGLAYRWWRLEQLVAFAEADPDIRIRAYAAEAACREAVWTRRLTILHRLARNRRPEVRVVALTGLARAGQDEQVHAHLDDDSALVRAVARDAAHRAGVDVLLHYREAVTQTDPALGAIAGLAETGSSTDAAAMTDLLAHPEAKVRSQAVRGLRQLAAASADEMIALLRDPSPSVVREATAALQAVNHAVPAGLPWQLLSDQRVELRRAGYRLLRGQATTVQLRAALVLAADPHPRLAQRGRADATRLARDAASQAWRHARQPTLSVTLEELADLEQLAGNAAASLGEETTALLLTWLHASRPR
jgi:hypothetical protein